MARARFSPSQGVGDSRRNGRGTTTVGAATADGEPRPGAARRCLRFAAGELGYPISCWRSAGLGRREKFARSRAKARRMGARLYGRTVIVDDRYLWTHSGAPD